MPKREPDDDFLRQLTFPEEELRRMTTARRLGDRRWFLSDNIIPMEHHLGKERWGR
jgi:hypothetical protein